MSTVAYLRRSSAPNADTRTVSFEMQEAAIRERAAKEGATIDAVLSDWAKSGGSDRRPGYQQLLAGIRSGTVTRVYSYSLSRLSRSLMDFASLLELCRKHEVSVLFAKDKDMDASTASSRGYATMVAAFAQMEREIAQERVQSAVDARRDRGDHLGQAPYGYRVSAGRLVRRDDEDPMAVVQAFRDAGSFGGAAKLLNERGVPTRRRGTMWNHGTVADIVRQTSPEDVPVATKRARAKMRTGTMLAGLLRCPCGSTLTPRRFQGVTAYYCARSYRIPGHGKTTTREAAVLPWIKAEAARLRVPDAVAVETMSAERADLERRRQRVLEAFMDGDIDRAEKSRRMRTLDEAEARLEAQMRAETLPSIEWDTDDPDAINAVLRTLWRSVTLDGDLLPVEADWLVPSMRD